MLAAFYRRVVCSAGGVEPAEVWSDCKVVSTAHACPSGKSLLWRVSVSPELGRSYKIPGQFVKLRLNKDIEPLFLAMCSAPSDDDNTFEFLVKTTKNINWLTGVASGTSVQLSHVLGGGFPLEDFVSNNNNDDTTTSIQNVLLVAAGSGIAPLKACIESGRLNVGGTGGRTCQVYYGEWTADDLCFPTLYKDWEKAGITIVPCLSRPPDSWTGRRGYVQLALKEEHGSSPDGDDNNNSNAAAKTSALLCGMDDMVVKVTSIFKEAGVPPRRILINL